MNLQSLKPTNIFKYLSFAISILLLTTIGCGNTSPANNSSPTPNRIVASKATRFGLNFEPGAIASVCQNPSYSKTEIGDQLNQLIQDFSSKEARIKNPDKFVSAIDAVLSKTNLAPILKCRDQLNRTPGFIYALKFQDPSRGNLSMQVTTEEIGIGSEKKLKKTLEFNLIKSVEKVIFVYLHELTHICQAPEFEIIYSNYEADSHNSELVGDIYRQKILGEVEAFLTMNLAYTELVKFTPALCMENGSAKSPTISEGYVDSENSLLDGSFAQTIIFGYADYYKSHEEYILDANSSARDYKTAQLAEGKFSLKKLNPKMKAKIESLGIFVDD